MPSVKVLNQSDARPWHFQELLPSNGRWRIVVFAGDISKPAQKEKLNNVGVAFDDKRSCLRKFTPSGARYDEVFEILTVHSAPRTETTIFDFPKVFSPYDELDGWDYSKILVDDQSYHEGHGKMYETFGISDNGCIVILRPDQYVSYVGSLEDVDSVNTFFSGFMRSTQCSKNEARSGDVKDDGVQSSEAQSTGVQDDGAQSNGLKADPLESMPM